MTPSARAFMAAGTPGLARLLALVSFLLIGFALPPPAAAQVTPLITITTPENVCEGGTAVFPIALNVAQNEDIEIRHFVASATTHFVAGTSTTFTIPEGETSVEARLVTRVNPSSTDNIVTFLGISTTNNIARTPAQVNVRIVDQSRAACASQPPTTTTAPDLTVDGVTVSSASVVEGASFTINATVNNEGNAASAATTLTYYRSANDTISTEDTSIATDPIGILAASGSSTQNASVSIADAETYYVGACVATVSGESNATNNCSTGVQVTVTEPAAVAPQITTQPTDQSVTVGDDATFTVAATGTPTPTYQWSFDGTAISGATSASYTVSGAALTNAGDYTVVVTNTAGTVTSTAATLTVTAAAVAPQITTQPTDQSVTVGENATFTVTATGTPTPTYQWRFEGSDIAGATSASYTLSNAALTNAGDYTVVVTNTAGTVTSSAATLTVTAAVAPQITTQPTNQSVTVGETATFTVAATGTPTPTYQWRKDGTAIAGATSASYAISSAALTDAGSYTVVVTNTAGTVTSTAATLTVTAPAGPDLTVDAPTRISSTPSLGVPFEADVTVRNQGTSGSAATVLRYFISSDATITTADTELTTTPATLSVGALSANGQQSISAVFSISTAGASWVGACVTAVSGETNTNNNCSTGVQIQVADQPDLTVRDASVSSASVATGTSFTINATVHNIGSAAAAATTLTYYRSANQSIGTSATSIGTDSVSALAASGSSAENISVSIDTVGTYWVGACVATLSDEANLENNCSTGVQVTITDPPTVLSWDTSNGTTFSENGLSGIIRLIATPPVDTRVNFSWSITPGNEDGVVQSLSRTTPDGVIGAGADGVSLVGSLTNDNIVDAIEYVDIAVTSATRQDGGVVTFDNSGGKRWSVTNDDATVVSISPTATGAEQGLITFTVNLTAQVAEEFELAWEAADGTGTNAATVADDLEAQTGRVRIPANRSTATFQIQTSADNVVEADEVFTVTLTGAALGLSNVDPDDVSIHADNHTATGMITDPDTAEVSLRLTAPPGVEGGAITFTVELDNPVAETFSLGWAASDGTATVNDDLDDQSGTVEIPANTRTATFEIPVTNDDAAEGSEMFTVALTGAPTGLVNIEPDWITVDRTSATGTINASDDPANNTISIRNSTVAEDVAGGRIGFTVNLDKAVDRDVEFEVTYAPGSTNSVTLTGDQADLGVRTASVRIDANTKEATFTVPVIEDTIVEGNETFTVTIFEDDELPPGVTIPDDTATGTITDNDTANVSLSSTPPPAASEGGTITFTVELDNPVAEAFSLGWAASNGTATVNDDLDDQSGTVEIAANARTATFDIPVTRDDRAEDSQTFTVALTGAPTGLVNIAPSRVTVDRSSATGTINASIAENNAVSIGNASKAEESGSIKFTVNLNQKVDSDVELEVTYAPGSTNSVTLTGAQADLGVRTASVRIDANTNEATFTVPIENDKIVEGDETFTVTIFLDDPVPGVIIPDNDAEGTITDSDTAVVSLSSTAPPPASEGETITFTVELDNPVAEAFSLGWAASNGDDLDDQTGTVDIPANARTATFDIPVTRDDEAEGSETFTVALTGAPTGLVNIAPNRVTVDRTSATGTINASTAPPPPTVGISIGTASATEGDDIRFTVTVTPPLLEARTLNVGYTAGTGNTGAELGDLGSGRPTTLTLPTGTTRVNLDVPTVDDTTDENNETFTVTLSLPNPPANPRNTLTITGSTATGTIRDNDGPSAPSATVSITAEKTALENAAGGGTATFKVNLSRTVISDVVLAVAYAGGTNNPATPADDLGRGRPTTVTINRNTTEATLTVPINNDAIVEGDETFTVTLSEDKDTPLPDDVTIGNGVATGTIVDDDKALVTLSPAELTAAENGTFTYTIRLSAEVDEAVNITWTATNGTATVADDLDEQTSTVTIKRNTTEATLTVPINNDAIVEDDETFTVTLSEDKDTPLPDDVTIGNGVATGTIEDDDTALVTLSPAELTAAENGTFTYTVRLSAEVDEAVNITWTATNGTATVADDLEATTNTVTFNAGSNTNQTFSIVVNDDTIVEGDETFTVTLTPVGTLPDGVTIPPATASSAATITENDTAVLGFTGRSFIEEEGTTVTLPVSFLSSGSATSATVDVTLTWTAVATNRAGGEPGQPEADLDPFSGTVTIPAGESSADITMTLVDDEDIEPAEDFFIRLGLSAASPLPPGVSLVASSHAAYQRRGRITDNDDPTAVTVSVDDVSVAEDVASGMATFTAQLTQAVDSAVVLDVAVTAGTATLADDLGEDLPETVTIDANTTEATFTVPIENDEIVEGNETFTVTLSESSTPLPAGVTIPDGTATGTIEDDDTAEVTLSTNTLTVAEDGTFTYTVSLSAAADEAVTVRWTATAESGDTATVADDLQEQTNTVTFDANDNTAQEFTIAVNDDDLDEDEETFTVTLEVDTQGSNPLPTGVTIGTGNSATGTITDNDDTPDAEVSIGNASVAENDGNAEFTVSLTTAVDSDVTLAVAYAAGTATLATDLGTRPDTVTIDATTTEATLLVPITNDEIVEGNEDFTVTISEGTTPLPDGVTIGTAATGTGTITDNDTAEVTLSTTTPTAAENGTFTYTVSLSAPADEAVVVRWTATAESGDTATVDDDLQEQTGTVTFDANDNTAQEFTIAVNDDDLDEDNETFTVTLEVDTEGGNPLPTGVTIGTTNSVTGTITDNDDTSVVTATVSIDNASVAENGGNAEFTVSLTTAVDSAVTLAVAYTAGTATLATDLGTRPTTVTIDQNQTSATLLVPIINDNLVEGNEDFTVTLSEGATPLPDGVTIGTDNTATGTIEDDDRSILSINPRPGRDGGATLTLTVNLTKPLVDNLEVKWTATRILGDELRSGTVTIRASETSARFPIDITGLPPGLSLEVALSDEGLPPEVRLDNERDSATVTIIAEVAADATVSIADADPVKEDAGPARFTVSLSRTVDSDVVLDITYAAGSAGLEDLGRSRPGTVTIPANATTAIVAVPITDDTAVEETETFTVTISDDTTTLPEGITIADGTATGTIAFTPEPSILIEPRRTGAGTALRRHVGRFDRMTSTVVRNRLGARETRHLSGSRDLGNGALAMGGELGDTNWGVWMDGAWAGLGGRSSGRQMDIYGGVDYRGSGGDWLIGALIGHELADLDIGPATYEAGYTHFGLYGGGRLSARLLVDGALTYGLATPEVAQGSVSASYDAHRITARGALTGDFGLDYGLEDGVVKLQPQLGLLYAREQLGAFTDSVGRVAERERLELGRLSAGPRLTWAFDGGQLIDGGQLAGGARGQWDFQRLGDGIDERVSGAVDVGLTLDLTPGVSLGVQGDVDGLGITDEFRSFGGKIKLGIRF